MDPTVWGPKLWFVIHTFALNYPDNPRYEDKRVMEEFFNNLKYSIPCNKCKVHYRQRLERDPIINYLDNKQSLFKYTIEPPASDDHFFEFNLQALPEKEVIFQKKKFLALEKRIRGVAHIHRSLLEAVLGQKKRLCKFFLSMHLRFRVVFEGNLSIDASVQIGCRGTDFVFGSFS